MLYDLPPLSPDDTRVLHELAAMRGKLAEHLRTPRRWAGRLRRTAVARAIQGSNSIEGYVVALDEAEAALDGDDPISADVQTFREIAGYRQALGFVLATAGDENFRLDSSTLRSMHYMLLSHALDKSPGQYRRGEIFVSDEDTGRHLYVGPDATQVAPLVDELMRWLDDTRRVDPFVQGAMAHLNLVMIHPFRDGNGRMARALQTLVLTRAGLSAPELSSIEEWLGAHTEDYHRALASSSDGSWSPRHDASTWLTFSLRAHHLQAQTVLDRISRAATAWTMLDDISAARRLPDRTLDILYSATLGMRVRRGPYVRDADIDERTGSRDLKMLTDSGLLRAVGNTNGRHHIAGPALEEVVAVLRSAAEPTDPYPGFRARLYG
ncbi:Fic family protein [Oerskovia turbata]